MSDGVRAMWMRGGSSKGGYFLADDLPADRDAFLLGMMGSPDARQIDGMGGADPLTSKVAIVRRSRRDGIDVDYLFLQVAIERALVSDGQNCGNILAGVGPFAIERGLVAPRGEVTPVVVFMQNTGKVAEVRVQTPGGRVSYRGRARIDGVPGGAAAVEISFRDVAGASCGALLPTGNASDVIDGVEATLIDNGMPSVMLRARDLGLRGDEPCDRLEADADLRARLEAIRLAAGARMGLGDVTDMTVPKLVLLSAPRAGGAIATRSFIPHRCHKAIGVFGALSVAAACLLEGGVAGPLAQVGSGAERRLSIEHPSGEMRVILRLGADGAMKGAAILRTARKLMDGVVFARGH